MKLLIGCPVRAREWIIGSYLEHAVEAARKVTEDFAFVFVAPESDHATLQEIDRKSRELCVTSWVAFTAEETGVDRRVWNTDRYDHMVYLRNTLLRQVRESHQKPDFFLSLYSDILIHPEQIRSLVDNIEGFDAIGGKAHLSVTGTRNPTYGMFKRGQRDGSFRRSDHSGVMQVDVLMAIKLMKPSAYAIDYVPNRYGEDIGWSLAAKEAELLLRWDGTYTSKHVMKPDLLDKVDDRCGY